MAVCGRGCQEVARSKLAEWVKCSPSSVYSLLIVVILDKEVSYDVMEKDRELAENSNVQDQDKVRWERY